MKIRLELEVDVEFGLDNDPATNIDHDTVAQAIVEVIHSDRIVDNLIDTVSERANCSISSMSITTPEVEFVDNC